MSEYTGAITYSFYFQYVLSPLAHLATTIPWTMRCVWSVQEDISKCCPKSAMQLALILTNHYNYSCSDWRIFPKPCPLGTFSDTLAAHSADTCQVSIINDATYFYLPTLISNSLVPSIPLPFNWDQLLASPVTLGSTALIPLVYQ